VANIAKQVVVDAAVVAVKGIVSCRGEPFPHTRPFMHQGGRLVRLPRATAGLAKDFVTLNAQGFLRTPLDRIPTSIDNMKPSHPFIQTLRSMPLVDDVSAHSIIAVKGNGPAEQGGDGIVKYNFGTQILEREGIPCTRKSSPNAAWSY
jgi:hypothetical protein